MANLFRCVDAAGGVNFNVYTLETNGGNTDVVEMNNYVLTWDCTSIPNWERLNINNFIFGGDYDTDNSPIKYYTYFSGQGNSDLARHVSVFLLKAEYDSTSGIYKLTFKCSSSNRTGGFGSNIWVTPRIFIPN